MTFLRTAFTSAALLAGGLFAMTPGNADAQVRFHIGGSNDGHRYSGSGYGSGVHQSNAGYYGRTGFRSSNYGRYGSHYDRFSGGQRYGGSRQYQGSWHDTSHYDYHPTTLVPHRNHYHIVPGHYHYHQSGHRH